MKKPHGNTGKRHAAKLNPLTAAINFRCSEEQKQQLNKLAEIKGVKPAQLMIDLLSQELAKHDFDDNKATKAYKVIVPVSGGKDSQCCLKMAVDEHGADNVLGLFCDTRFEHPLVYQHVEHIKTLYGAKIITLQSETETIEGMVTRFNRFPDRIARFCTDRLKIQPVRKFLKAYAEEFGEVEVWYGMRTDESQARSIRYQYRDPDELYQPHEVLKSEPKYLGKLGVRYRLPINDWNSGEVFEFLGGKHCQLYDQGFDRVGCFPCLASGDGKKVQAFTHDEFGNSQLIKVRVLEDKIGKSVFTSGVGRRFNEGIAIKESELNCDSSHGCRICEI